MSPTVPIDLCPAADIAPGRMMRFEPEGMDPIVVCNHDGEFYAVDDECTHAIASLSEGRLDGCTLFCPMHGGSFDIRTGAARTLPCRQALRTYPLAVAEGVIRLLRPA